MGISENRIVVLTAADEEDTVDETAAVMTLSETTSAYAVADLQFYSYRIVTTSEYGCGGQYRQVDTEEPNCFGYALFLNKSPDINPAWGSSHITEDFSEKFEYAIKEHYPCRRIASYTDAIYSNEYRLAVRCPNRLNNTPYIYHVIYQLSDGTWAGKNHTSKSKHFTQGNPTTNNWMWENNAYSDKAGTIYFAVTKCDS